MIPIISGIGCLREAPPSPGSKSTFSMGEQFIEKAATGNYRDVDELIDCTAIHSHQIGEAFQKSCENGHVKVAELIRERRPDDVYSGHLTAALCSHVKKESSLGPIRFLFEKFDPLLTPDDKKLIYATAIAEGPIAVVAYLLDSTESCLDGLRQSAELNRLEMFTYLLDTLYFREASTREIENLFLHVAQHSDFVLLKSYMQHADFPEISPIYITQALILVARRGRRDMVSHFASFPWFKELPLGDVLNAAALARENSYEIFIDLMSAPQFQELHDSGNLYNCLSSKAAEKLADTILHPYIEPEISLPNSDLVILERKIPINESQANQILGILCIAMSQQGELTIPLPHLSRIAASDLFQATTRAINHKHPEVAISIIYSPAFTKLDIPQVESICLLACNLSAIEVILAIIRPRSPETPSLLNQFSVPVLESCFVKSCELGHLKIFRTLTQSAHFGDIGEDAFRSSFVKVARKALPRSSPPNEYTEIYNAFFTCGRFSLLTTNEFYAVFSHVIQSKHALTLNELVGGPCFEPDRLSKDHFNLLIDEVVIEANPFMFSIFFGSNRSDEIAPSTLEKIFDPLVHAGQMFLPHSPFEENARLALQRKGIVEEIVKSERFFQLLQSPTLGAVFLTATGLGFTNTVIEILSKKASELPLTHFLLALFQTGWEPNHFLVFSIDDDKPSIKKRIILDISPDDKRVIFDALLKTPQAQDLSSSQLIRFLTHAVSREDEETVNIILHNRSFSHDELSVVQSLALDMGLLELASGMTYYKTQ